MKISMDEDDLPSLVNSFRHVITLGGPGGLLLPNLRHLLVRSGCYSLGNAHQRTEFHDILCGSFSPRTLDVLLCNYAMDFHDGHGRLPNSLVADTQESIFCCPQSQLRTLCNTDRQVSKFSKTGLRIELLVVMHPANSGDRVIGSALMRVDYIYYPDEHSVGGDDLRECLIDHFPKILDCFPNITTIGLPHSRFARQFRDLDFDVQQGSRVTPPHDKAIANLLEPRLCNVSIFLRAE